jgi:hypothetical protein
MDHGKLVRNAIVIGIVLVVVILLAAVGAPMIGMIRAHLGV